MDSESDWDTASEAEVESPKRLNNRYPKIDSIAEVPEEQNWKPNATPKGAPRNIEIQFKQYNTDDEEDKDVNMNNSTQNMSSKSNFRTQELKNQTITAKTHTPEQNFGDFKSALTEPKNLSGQDKVKIPGKERKGNLYDPAPNRKDMKPDATENYNYNLASWDSDEDARVLAELRTGYQKGKKVEEEAKRKLEETAIVLEVKEPDPVTPTKQSQLQETVNSPRALKNEKPLKGGQPYLVEENDEFRIIYPFEEGNKEFFHATESPSDAYLPAVADTIEMYIRRGWQEFFAALRILTGFIFIFIVELLLFLTRDTIYKLLVKVIIIIGNFLVKPLLSNTFNAVVQPLLIFLWNIFAGIRNMLDPVIDIIRGVSEQIALMFGSFRLVHINWNVVTPDALGASGRLTHLAQV